MTEEVAIDDILSVSDLARGVPIVHVYKGDTSRVVVGSHAFVAEDVQMIVGGNHRTDWVTNYPLREWHQLPGAYNDNPWSKGDIVVESGALLGHGTRVMSGVTIGLGAQTEPHSVVTRSVPPFTMVNGNPAREVGLRFSNSVIHELLEVDWNAPTTDLRDALKAVIQHEAETAFPAVEVGCSLGMGRSNSSPDNVPSLRRKVQSRLGGLLAEWLNPRVGGLQSVDDWYDVSVGEGTYGNLVVVGTPPLGQRASVSVGRYTSIAAECEVCFVPHASVAQSTRQSCSERDMHAPKTDRKPTVTVGSDVWLGRGSKLLAGVTVADGAVVGAYSVVTQDVPPYAIVVGNPARMVRRRFDDETVGSLLKIRWWDWPEERILSQWSLLCSPDVQAFVDRFSSSSP